MNLSCYLCFGKKPFKIEKDDYSFTIHLGFVSICLGVFNIENILKNFLKTFDKTENSEYNLKTIDEKIKKLKKDNEELNTQIRDSHFKLVAFDQTVYDLKKEREKFQEEANDYKQAMEVMSDDMEDLEIEKENLKEDNKELEKSVVFWKEVSDNGGYGR